MAEGRSLKERFYNAEKEFVQITRAFQNENPQYIGALAVVLSNYWSSVRIDNKGEWDVPIFETHFTEDQDPKIETLIEWYALMQRGEYSLLVSEALSRRIETRDYPPCVQYLQDHHDELFEGLVGEMEERLLNHREADEIR